MVATGWWPVLVVVSTRIWKRVDNKKVERWLAATKVSTGREEERLTKSTVLFMRG
jgi:hypothetical protein